MIKVKFLIDTSRSLNDLKAYIETNRAAIEAGSFIYLEKDKELYKVANNYNQTSTMPIEDISTVLHFIGSQNILQEVANIQATLTDNIYDKDDIDGLLETKAEANSIYDKSTIDGLLQAKADANSVYNKTTINGLLKAKADADSVYDKNAIDVLLDDKIDKDISSLTIGDLTINSNSISKKVTNNTTTTTSNVLFDDDLSFTKQSGSDEIATISYKNTTYSILKEKYINSASVVNVIKQENDYYENTVSTDNKIGNGLVSNVGQYIKLTFNTDNSDIIYINVDSIGAEYSGATGTDINIAIDQTTHTIGASLTETGVTAKTYGSVLGNSISMPAFSVDSAGRITSAEEKSFNLPTIADASNSAKGVVQVGNNITVNDGTISLSKDNVTSALGYTPYNQNDLAGVLGNYKTKQTAVSTPTTTTTGDVVTFIDSISQNANGEITATKRNVAFPDYSNVYQPKGNYKTTQTAVNSPAASGEAIAFIDGISQNANGVITATKKSVQFPDYSETYQEKGNYKTVQTAISDPTAEGNSTTFIATIAQDANGKITATKKSVNFPDYSDTYQAKGSYKTTQTAVTSPNAEGNATAFIDTISQDTQGKISITKKNIQFPDYSETYQAKGDYKTKQTAVTSPAASGNTAAFIDTISQDANGKITVTKKNVDFPDYSETYQAKGNYKSVQSAVTDPTADGNSTTFIATISQDTQGKIAVTKKNVQFPDYSDTYQPKGNYKSVQSAVSTPDAQGNAAAFIDSISQDAQGKITISKKNVNFPDYSNVYQPKGNYKSVQTAISDPTAEGNSTTFIATISQDAQGKITATKKSVAFPDYSNTYKKIQTAVSSPTASGNATAFIDSISQDEQGKITISKKNVQFPDYSDTYQAKGSYKTTQSEVKSPTASGNATAFIDTITQNANGAITVTKKNVDLSSKMDKANPTGTGYLSLNAATTPGSYSIAAGYSTTASGIAATALGSAAQATADYALATGYGTLASGSAATATGRNTTAKTANSFASGLGTIAAAPNQAVFGQYNKEDADALFVVGNGSGGEAAQRTNLMWLTSQGYLHATKVYGAVWNDYAEYRQTHHKVRPGQCVYEKGDGSLAISYERMMPGANIVSDTFGFAIGETDECKTPLAVSGRVLAYPYESKETYNPGDAVCSGPNGTISKMTRAEIRDYPERIVGTVSEIPTYEVWGSGDIKVNGRIWIKVR